MHSTLLKNILTCGPRIHNSPTSFGPTFFPVFTSTIFPSVLDIRTPHDPGIMISSLVDNATGDNSVMPQPSRNFTFGAFFLNSSTSVSPTGAAPTYVGNYNVLPKMN